MSISLGDINFGLGADASRLNDAMRLLENFGRAVDKSSRTTEENIKSVDSLLRKQEASMVAMVNRVQGLASKFNKKTFGQPYIEAAHIALEDYIAALSTAKPTPLNFQRSSEQFNTRVVGITRGFQGEQDAETKAAKAEAAAIRQERAAQKLAIVQAREAKKASDAIVRETRIAETAVLRQEAALSSMAAKIQARSFAFSQKSFGTPFIEEANKIYTKFANNVQNTKLSAAEVRRFTQEANFSLQELQQRFRSIKLDSSPWRSFFTGITQATTGVAGPLSATGRNVRALSDVLSGTTVGFSAFAVGAGLGAVAAYKLGTATVKAAVQVQQINQALLSVTGSQEKANRLLEDVADISNRAGTELSSTAQAYARFTAAAKGTAIEGKVAREVFDTISLAGAKMSLTVEQQEAAFLALEQMMSKGRVSREELVKQFGNAFPGAFQIAQRAMSDVTDNLDELLKKGLATEDFLPRLVAEIRKTYNLKDGEEAIVSYNAALGRLSTATTIFFAEVDNNLGLSKLLQMSIDGWAFALQGAAAAMHDGTDAANGTNSALGAMQRGIEGNSEAFQNNSATVSRNIDKQSSLTNGIGKATQELDNNTVTVNQNQLAVITAIPLLNKFMEYYYGVSLAANTAAAAIDQVSNSIGKGDQEAFAPQTVNIKGKDDLDLTPVLKEIRGLDEATKQAYSSIERLRAGPIAGLTEQFRYWGEIDRYTKSLFEAGLGTAEVAVHVDKLKTALIAQQRTEEGIAAAKKASKKEEAAIKAAEKKAAAEAARAAKKAAAEEIKIWEDKAKAWKSAGEAIEILNRKISILNQQQQDPNNKSLENSFKNVEDIARFEQALTDAGLSADIVTMKTKEFSAALEGLDASSASLERLKTNLEAIRESGVQAFDTMSDGILDALGKGEASFKKFGELGKQVLADLLKDTIKFTLLNPLKNFLFGGQAPGGPGNNTGGLLGAIFKGIFQARQGAAFDGQITRMRSGGMINTPTLFNTSSGIVEAGESGREAILPLKRNGKGELGVATSGTSSRQRNTPLSVHLTAQIDARGSDAGVKQKIEAALEVFAGQIESVLPNMLRTASLEGRI